MKMKILKSSGNFHIIDGLFIKTLKNCAVLIFAKKLKNSETVQQFSCTLRIRILRQCEISRKAGVEVLNKII
jgi:hypothetical protein